MNDLLWLFVPVLGITTVVAIFLYISSRKKQPTNLSEHVASVVDQPELVLVDKDDATDLLFLDPESKETFLEISQFEMPVAPLESYKRAELGGLERSLSPLVQSLPTFANLASAGQPYLKVTFTEAAMKALGNGDLALVATRQGDQLLPVLRNVKTGRFHEVATLKNAALKGGMKVATLATAAWQIATIVTAQHHLGEISVRLDQIENGIRRIENFLRDEEKAGIFSSINILRDYANCLRQGTLSPGEVAAIIVRFEDIEALSLSILSRAKASVFRIQDGLQNIKVGALIDRNASMQRIHDAIDNMKDELEVISLAAQCRIVACSVKSLLPGNQALVRRRLKDTLEQIREISESSHQVRDIIEERSRELRKRSGLIFILDKELRQGILGNISDFEKRMDETEECVGRHTEQSENALSMIAHFQNSSREFLAKVNEDGTLELLASSDSVPVQQ